MSELGTKPSAASLARKAKEAQRQYELGLQVVELFEELDKSINETVEKAYKNHPGIKGIASFAHYLSEYRHSDMIEAVKAIDGIVNPDDEEMEINEANFSFLVGMKLASQAKQAEFKDFVQSLKAGTYKNPHTGEVVIKDRRPKATIEEWVTEYGLSEVRNWLVK